MEYHNIEFNLFIAVGMKERLNITLFHEAVLYLRPEGISSNFLNNEWDGSFRIFLVFF